MSRALWWLALCGVTLLALACNRPTGRENFKGRWIARLGDSAEVADFAEDSVHWSGFSIHSSAYVVRGDTAIVLYSGGGADNLVLHGDSIVAPLGMMYPPPGYENLPTTRGAPRGVMHRVR